MNRRLLLTCLTLCLSHAVSSVPLESSAEKSGREEVKEAVQKAELDASLAAQDAVKHGHKAETRVESIKSSETSEGSNDLNPDEKPAVARKHETSVSDLDEGPHIKRVKEHKVNRKPGGMGKMLGLGELGDLGGNNNEYKEDTRLEDRLAMEAEEEKKYETGEGYGTGGGGGGGGGAGGGWEDGGKGANWASNIQRQDAAEKQSIQAQVASESAHELDEIQRAIAAESQSSRGSASIGNGGASVVGGAGGVQDQEGMQPRISNPEGGRGQPMAFVGAQQKGITPSENQEEFQEYSSPYLSDQSSLGQPEISSLVHQADKILPGEMRGSSQQNNMVIGGLGARGSQGLSEGIANFGGMEGGQQLGAQSQVSPMEQPSIASERAGYGGTLEQGAVNQEGLGQGGLAGLSDSAVSRMNEGGAGGGSLQGIQGAQDVQGMQSLTSAFAGGQQVQGGMLSDGGGVNSLQGQGLMGGSLQGGLQGMMGGGLAGLSAMGGGGQFAQQQMSFKKSTIARPRDFQRSKTHQKEETRTKHRKPSKTHKDAFSKSSVPNKHLMEDRKTVSVKKEQNDKEATFKALHCSVKLIDST
ncbi:spidroin-1-like isoform X4 [Stylophora pistillata]|uniref:spidroin-1-like isoform X4 n=1 Tax=Stylophora pistillata TaxID=50429 RepID=UPI000C053E3E|nr:spidroin-1-like isoform X4 [Stylophora pistillata]